jgi:hypothetical protein
LLGFSFFRRSYVAACWQTLMSQAADEASEICLRRFGHLVFRSASIFTHRVEAMTISLWCEKSRERGLRAQASLLRRCGTKGVQKFEGQLSLQFQQARHIVRQRLA